MMVYAAFVAGSLTYVAIDWSHWKVPGTKWSGYWSDHVGPNIANGLLSLVAFVAWRSHILAQILDLFGVHTDSPLMKIDVTEPIAFVAGIVLSFVTVIVSKRLWPAKAEPEGKEGK